MVIYKGQKISEEKNDSNKNKVSKTWGPNTLNNFTDQELKNLMSWQNEVTKMVISKEIGENGTPHLQFTVTFKKAKRFSTLKKWFKRVHWEVTIVRDSAFLYCKKDESEILLDIDNSKQGHRTDLDDLAESIKRGKSIKGLWKEHSTTMLRYYKGAYEMKRICQLPSTVGKFKIEDFEWDPIKDWSKCHILWGESQIGKTQFALAHFKNPKLVRHLDDLKDFDQDEHDGIVFDDMSFNHLPRETQIHILDIENPSSIHCRFFNALIPAYTKKIFTTNVEDGNIFGLMDDAIFNRVTVTEVRGGNT